jgi:hypothetical protein
MSNEPTADRVASARVELERASRETAPQEWARLQKNLGDALLQSSQGVLEWKLLQPRFGNPYLKLQQSGLGDVAKEARGAYMSALEECAPDKDLDLWASALAGATDAWLRLSLSNYRFGTYTDMFQASKSLQYLLSHFPCERNPLLWATTQHRLACARFAMAVRKDDPDDPEAPLRLGREAVDALGAAAQAYLKHGYAQHHQQMLEQIEAMQARIVRAEKKIRQRSPSGPASS